MCLRTVVKLDTEYFLSVRTFSSSEVLKLLGFSHFTPVQLDTRAESEGERSI